MSRRDRKANTEAIMNTLATSVVAVETGGKMFGQPSGPLGSAAGAGMKRQFQETRDIDAER